VPFGVDADRFLTSNRKPDPFSVLFVGQLRPYKGVEVLLHAWRKVQQSGSAELHIVGEGHQRAELEALAANLGLSSVRFHGSVSEKRLRERYATSHALVLPSNRKAEAFGLVLLEGMAAGAIPISSDLPGVKDVVSTTGFTFPVGDSDALADLLIMLRDDKAKRHEMSMLATARAFALSWDHTIEAYVGIYKQVYLARQLEASLTQSSEPDTLQSWLQQVTRMAKADRASLMLLATGGHRLRIAASIGLSPEVIASTSLAVGERMAGYAAHTGRPILVRRKGMPAVGRLYGRNPNLTSALVLPLSHKGSLVGVLNLARGAGHVAFTQADMRWLHKLALQVAPLLSRVRPAAASFPSGNRVPKVVGELEGNGAVVANGRTSELVVVPSPPKPQTEGVARIDLSSSRQALSGEHDALQTDSVLAPS
jgi:hypothetical protein